MTKKYGLLTAISMVVGIVIGSGVFFKVQNILKKHNLWNGLTYALAFHEIDARRYARKTMKKYNKELNALIEKAYNNELDQLLY